MKAFRIWSEISYGLSETSRGASPKTRRIYKQRLSKVRREMDKSAIADGMLSGRTAVAYPSLVEDPCTKDQEVARMWADWKTRQARLDGFCKEIECDSMWHNHTL